MALIPIGALLALDYIVEGNMAFGIGLLIFIIILYNLLFSRPRLVDCNVCGSSVATSAPMCMSCGAKRG